LINELCNHQNSGVAFDYDAKVRWEIKD